MPVLFSYVKKSTKKNAFLRLLEVGWAADLFGILLFSAVFLPYIIATIRGTTAPVLPFISYAAGSPPQSGIFSIFLSLSAIVAFLGLHLLHLAIGIYQERVPKERQQTLKFLNKASLIPGHFAILGMLVVGGFPVSFHRHTEDWILVTIVPHLIGASMLFGGGVIYCSVMTIVVALVFPWKKKLLSTRIILLSITILSALMHALTVKEAFYLEYYDEDRTKLCFPKDIQYDRNYLVSSVCEWVMAVTFITFLMTIREEGNLMSVTVSVDILDSISETQDSTGYSKISPSSEMSSESAECLAQDDKTALKTNQGEPSRKKKAEIILNSTKENLEVQSSRTTK